MNWADKRVLVTGGAGFIGSNLVKKLVSIGSEVVVADNLIRGKIQNLEPILNKIQYHNIDLTGINECKQICTDIDLVFHLAASVGGIQFITKENVGGLTPSLQMNVNMFEAARINDVERFQFASSACVYRDMKKGLNRFIEEDAYPANPLTTYGWVKLLGEIQCNSYYLDYGIKCSTPRIFNAYGENENLDPRWSHVIPSLMRKAILYPREGFTLFGDGMQERAFLYVQDCVEGLLLNMEKVCDAQAINLGSDEVTTIKELAKNVISISNKDIEIKLDISGPRGTNRYCADLTRMEEKLDWKPTTSLEEGLLKTYNWALGEIRV